MQPTTTRKPSSLYLAFTTPFTSKPNKPSDLESRVAASSTTRFELNSSPLHSAQTNSNMEQILVDTPLSRAFPSFAAAKDTFAKSKTMQNQLSRALPSAVAAANTATSARGKRNPNHLTRDIFAHFYDELDAQKGIHEADKSWVLKRVKQILEDCSKTDWAEAPPKSLENYLLTLDKVLYWLNRGYIKDPILTPLIFKLFEGFLKKEWIDRLSHESCLNCLSILGYAATIESNNISPLIPQALADFVNYLKNQDYLDLKIIYFSHLINTISRLNFHQFDTGPLCNLYTSKINNIQALGSTKGLQNLKTTIFFFKKQDPENYPQEIHIFLEAVSNLISRQKEKWAASKNGQSE